MRDAPSDENGCGKLLKYLDRIIELALIATLVLFGGIQLGIYDRQGKITKRQTEIMERQIKLSEVVERPWIAIEGGDVLSPLAFKDGSAVLTIKFHLKNTGHVPAAHALILGKFFYRSNYPSKELNDVWIECEQYRVMPLETRGSGISIFPDQQQPMSYGAKMSSDDVKKLGVQSISGAPTFAGCIDYGWGGDATRHQTRFVYEIDKKGSDGNSIIFSPTDGDIQIADVIVNLNPFLAGNPD
jgi:hypothetical protein